MIEKKTYETIAGEWKGSVYQNYGRMQVRLPFLSKEVFPLFSGKHVLEIGCNAGIPAYEICKYAQAYTGVESERGYHRQSLVTRQFIDNPNVEFLNMSIKTFVKRIRRNDIKSNFDAVYCSYVLYHFCDQEVRMFEKDILSKVSLAVIPTRKVIKGRDYSHKNSYWLRTPRNVEKLLKNAGFVCKTVWPDNKKYFCTIGERP